MRIFNKNIYVKRLVMVSILCILFPASIFFAGRALQEGRISHKESPEKSGESWRGTFGEYTSTFYMLMPDEKIKPLSKRGEDNSYSGLVEIVDDEAGIYQRINYMNGIAEGEAQSFYKSGELYERGNFKNGQKEGEWIIYRLNGDVMSTEAYKDGRRHGKLNSFDEKGRLSEVINFRKGKRHGKYIQYRNGKPRYKSYYILGRRIKKFNLK